MELAERIYAVSKQLPEPVLMELLDFAEFLRQRKSQVVGQQIERASTDLDLPQGSVARTLALLATPRFAQRPKANDAEVAQRIAALRDDWDVRG